MTCQPLVSSLPATSGGQTSVTGQGVTPWVCEKCGYIAGDRPALLQRRALNLAALFQRQTLEYAVESPDLEAMAQAVLEKVIEVRDAVHRYTCQLLGLIDIEQPISSSREPNKVQRIALDFTWASVVGVVANLEDLAAAIGRVPRSSWVPEGAGLSTPALELVNRAVHTASCGLSAIRSMMS